MLDDGREKQAVAEKKVRDRRERLERKAQLENRWEMLRWITEYIDQNKDRWDEEARERRKDQGETAAEWENRSKVEKIEILKELSKKETWEMPRMHRVMVEVDEPTQSVAQPSYKRDQLVEVDEPAQSVGQPSHQSDQVPRMPKIMVEVDEPTQSVPQPTARVAR